jgi:hypothetical protein
LLALIGEVPYLNGGLFDLHELESANPDIDIPDTAFERLFAFFDSYDWHLDDRPLRAGNEINPDVLGYIFEKYINQKQMGAYYTKEDITEYIAKNTVIPHLLERAREGCKAAFTGEGSVWSLLRNDPNRYLYPAMKTGVIEARGELVPETVLPDFVQTGMHDPKARMFDRRYNLGEASFVTATGERGTLPTETWREYVERRTRCLTIRDQLAQGQVNSVDDLITLNLDIRQFMQDVIDTCQRPDLLRAIWRAIVGRIPGKGESHREVVHGITILDPTCGSGAFLFAALNILEPLYEACLDRMEGFIEDARTPPSPPGRGAGGEGTFPDFRAVLDEIARHPSRRYFVYKSIILHNLFGVDIMAEAVEICKLRLFLKLVSQVSSVRELQPLPDIDFNIRCGNTLVGYATEAQFDAAHDLASDQAHRDEIKARLADLADAFDGFREQQVVHGGMITAADKQGLRKRLNALSLELDRYLAREYGIREDKASEFYAWRASHQPFHWFAEFYGVMRESGFDAVIGNPPYVEYKDVRALYTVRNFNSQQCGDLYAYCTERALDISAKNGHIGLIVPISIFGTDGFATLQVITLSSISPAWISCFSNRPSQLFDGAQKRLSIVLGRRYLPGDIKKIFTTRYYRWNRAEFESLFRSKIQYAKPKEKFSVFPASLEKLGSNLEVQAFLRLRSEKGTLASVANHSIGFQVYYTRKFGYFLAFLDFIPEIINDRTGRRVPPSELKEINFASSQTVFAVIAALSSSTFFWFWNVLSDCRNLNKRDLLAFPLNPENLRADFHKQLANLGKQYLLDLRKTSKVMLKSGLKIETFNYSECKKIIDKYFT